MVDDTGEFSSIQTNVHAAEPRDESEREREIWRRADEGSFELRSGPPEAEQQPYIVGFNIISVYRGR